MLLTVGIGNTCIAFGLFQNAELQRYGRISLADLPALTSLVGDGPVSQIALASVAPSKTDQVVALLASAYCKPVLIAGRDLTFSMDIQCDDPSKVGVDRLLNAVAAFARTGAATVVVDVGTAVTVDLLSERGSFCGGAIAPGPETMLQSLAAHAELLPEIALTATPGILGHNTVDAMRAGVWHGAIGMVRELVARLREEKTGPIPLLVTGGAGEFIAAALQPSAEYLPHLTLEGLALLAQG